MEANIEMLKQQMNFFGFDTSEGIETKIETGSKKFLLPFQWREINVKECFRNCAVLTLQSENLRYCIGYAHKHIPMEHAWIYDTETKKYFDPTWEKFSDSLGDCYFALKIFKNDELLKIMEENENYAPDIFILAKSGFLKTRDIRDIFKNDNFLKNESEK